MKRIILILFCSFILFGFCGCSNNKKDLSGTYKIDVIHKKDGKEYESKGTLKVFDNGNCLITDEGVLINGENSSLGREEYKDCTYNVLDDTITFKYRNTRYDDIDYSIDECNIVDKGLFCESLCGIYEYNGEIWEKQ